MSTGTLPGRPAWRSVPEWPPYPQFTPPSDTQRARAIRVTFCPVNAWFSRLAARCRTASFAWWCAHVVAWVLIWSVILRFRVNLWFWIIGGGLAVSNIVGQMVLNRRAEASHSPKPYLPGSQPFDQ